jgi:hypothetical protein
MPSVLLWAPTQLHYPDHDLAGGVPGPGKLFVLENKAPYTDPKGGHKFELPVRQMHNYLCHPKLRHRTFYVLPCPPFGPGAVPEPSTKPGRVPTLIDDRALTRLPGHPWAPPGGAEEWFFVVPVRILWERTMACPPLPGVGWRRPADGPPPGFPEVAHLRCPLKQLEGALDTALVAFAPAADLPGW